MDIFWILVLVISALIFAFIFVKPRIDQQTVWFNAWQRLAEIGSIRDNNGDLVNPMKFKGYFRERLVEIRVVSFSGNEFGALNVSTSIAMHFDRSLDGYAYLFREGASYITQSQTSVKASNDFFHVISTPQKLEDIFLPLHLKQKLLRLPVERVQIELNRVIFLIPGVETEVDILYSCLLLVEEIAKNCEV